MSAAQLLAPASILPRLVHRISHANHLIAVREQEEPFALGLTSRVDEVNPVPLDLITENFRGPSAARTSGYARSAAAARSTRSSASRHFAAREELEILPRSNHHIATHGG